MQQGMRPLRSVRRLSNKLGQLPSWYSIKNSAAAGAPTQVSIYDEIGFYGVPAGQFLADMQGIQGDVELHLNSPGGDVFDGIAIYNTLRQRQGSVKVIVDGLAASAASFIAMAASQGQLEIAPHAQMMIHDGFAMGIGNAADLRDLADQLDTVSDEIAGIYSDRTGKPVAYWRAKMQAETWYTDKQAVEDGLADRIHGQAEPDPSQDWDLSVFARYAGIENADTHGSFTGAHNHAHAAYGSQGSDQLHSHMHDHNGDGAHGHAHSAASASLDVEIHASGNAGWVERDGKWVFDPDGDGDDDSSPSGDSDNDYWSADGKQLKSIPPNPATGKGGKPLPPGNQADFPILNADVDNSPWDASKAWAAGAASDDPAKFYAGICAGRKAGDPSTQGAWALPYRYSPSSPPNASGVRNALSRLPQTQGLTNEAEARSTLEKAMNQVNPDYEPDDSIDTELLAEVFSLGLEGSR